MLIIKYLLLFAFCYFTFILLQRRYTRRLSWGNALRESAIHCLKGALIILGSPAGVLAMLLVVVFIVMTLCDLL